jgi:hypothetical protein
VKIFILNILVFLQNQFVFKKVTYDYHFSQEEWQYLDKEDVQDVKDIA